MMALKDGLTAWELDMSIIKSYAPYYHLPEKTDLCDVCGAAAFLAYFDEFCEVYVCKDHDETGDSIFVWIDMEG